MCVSCEIGGKSGEPFWREVGAVELHTPGTAKTPTGVAIHHSVLWQHHFATTANSAPAPMLAFAAAFYGVIRTTYQEIECGRTTGGRAAATGQRSAVSGSDMEVSFLN